MGPDNLFVGNLVRDGSGHHIPSLSHVRAQTGSVALDLGGHRLERLEEDRAGGVLTMHMQLWPRVEMDGKTIHAKVAGIRLHISRDDWLALVGTFTGEQISWRSATNSRTRVVSGQASECSSVRAAVDRGDFDAAVIQARKAASLMEESFKDPGGVVGMSGRYRWKTEWNVNRSFHPVNSSGDYTPDLTRAHIGLHSCVNVLVTFAPLYRREPADQWDWF